MSMVGCVGHDAFGEALLENLASDGIDHGFVIQDPEAATGVALIVVDDAGQNSIVVASGGNTRLSSGDVEAAEAAIVDADVLLLQLESQLETVPRAFGFERVSTLQRKRRHLRANDRVGGAVCQV